MDGNGNVFYTETLTHVSPAIGGGAARSFGPNSTQPTVEDTGTAQLVGGAAVVRLDPAFAASIEPNASYRVFVTPDGDTNGLYVAAKTASGFLVREIHGGRSMVTFDYRIVATTLGASGQHMAILSPAAERARTAHPPPDRARGNITSAPCDTRGRACDTVNLGEHRGVTHARSSSREVRIGRP